PLHRAVPPRSRGSAAPAPAPRRAGWRACPPPCAPGGTPPGRLPPWGPRPPSRACPPSAGCVRAAVRSARPTPPAPRPPPPPPPALQPPAARGPPPRLPSGPPAPAQPRGLLLCIREAHEGAVRGELHLERHAGATRAGHPLPTVRGWHGPLGEVPAPFAAAE